MKTTTNTTTNQERKMSTNYCMWRDMSKDMSKEQSTHEYYTSCGNQWKIPRGLLTAKYCVFCGKPMIKFKNTDSLMHIRCDEVLTKPEQTYPKEDQVIYYLTGERTCGYIESRWQKNQYFIRLLYNGMIHLSEENAKRWALFWKELVTDKLEFEDK